MNPRNEEIKEKYHHQQRQGMQDLRFMLLLLALGLILYTALGFYCVYSMHERNDYLQFYLLYEVGSFVVWCLPIRMLWNFNRLGRLLYFVCIAASLYIYRDSMQIFTLEVHPEMFKYIGAALFIFKWSILLCGAYRLSAGKYIRLIWSMDTMFDEDLALLEEPTQSERTPSKKMEPFVKKAQKILRRASLKLACVLYLSLLLIMLLLSLLQNNVPTLSEGISVIQYALFSECLFSVMLWSAPIVVLYIGKTWSPYLIYAAILGELIRIVISYQNYKEVFYNKIIPTEVKLLFVMVGTLRYILLLFACRGIWHSNLIKRYSHMKMPKNRDV